MAPESRIIINDCASPPLPGLTPLRTRYTEFGARNISYSYGDVVAGLPERLTDIQLDWLHILGSIYAADIATKRGLLTPGSGRTAPAEPLRPNRAG